MKKYTIDGSNEESKYKRGKSLFGLSIVLGFVGIILLIVGLFVQNTKYGTPLSIVGAIVSMLLAFFLMYKSYADMMAYESLKMEREYDKHELYKLESVCKYEVKSKLLGTGFHKENEYFKKKKFSYLKDSITYYFRMVDTAKVFGSIERYIKEFELMDREGNSCLCLFVYVDHITEENLEDAKEFGKNDIVYETVINPLTQDSYVLVVVDRNTNEGYFLDIGKKYKSSLYSHGCKWIKRILDN